MIGNGRVRYPMQGDEPGASQATGGDGDQHRARTEATLNKRLFQANAVSRVLFLVDRIPLARQAEVAE